MLMVSLVALCSIAMTGTAGAIPLASDDWPTSELPSVSQPEPKTSDVTGNRHDVRDHEKASTGEMTREQRLIWMELQIQWKDSTAVGLPYRGDLVDGVQLPVEGQNFFTWDAVHDRLHNPDDRRWGTDDLLFTVFAVLDDYRRANPDAPRVGISDLSRPNGGVFGALYGGLGHRSHQNGLDVDIAYPRRDHQELGITHVDQIDLELSQDLINRFVEAGAQFIFVGENVDVTGPPHIVKPWPHHDDHFHLRIRPS